MRVAPALVDAHRHHLEQGVETAHPSGGLDLNRIRDRGAHQFEIFDGGAGRSEAGGSLDEVGTCGLGQLRASHLLVVGQVGILQNHLDQRLPGAGFTTAMMSSSTRRSSPGPQPPDVDDHVEFGRSVGEGLLHFEDLGGRRVRTVRKPDDGPDLHLGIPEACGEGDIGGANTDRRHQVVGRQIATLFDVGESELGPQQASGRSSWRPVRR